MDKSVPLHWLTICGLTYRCAFGCIRRSHSVRKAFFRISSGRIPMSKLSLSDVTVFWSLREKWVFLFLLKRRDSPPLIEEIEAYISFPYYTVHFVDNCNVNIFLESGLASGHSPSQWITGSDLLCTSVTQSCLIFDKRPRQCHMVISQICSTVATCIYNWLILRRVIATILWCQYFCTWAFHCSHICCVFRASLLGFYNPRSFTQWLRRFPDSVHTIWLLLFLLARHLPIILLGTTCCCSAFL